MDEFGKLRLCSERDGRKLPSGTRGFSYSSQAAYSRPTAKLGLRPQTVAPSGAASLLVATENSLTFRKGASVRLAQGFSFSC